MFAYEALNQTVPNWNVEPGHAEPNQGLHNQIIK